MLKLDHTKQFANATRIAIALGALAALGSQAAQAQVSAVTKLSQLTNPIKTSPYPEGPTSGNNAFVVPNGFMVAADTNTLTFTATNGTANASFQSAIADTTVAPQFSDPTFGGKAGDILENTTFVGANGNMATGPLLINFANPVAGFGLLAQDFNSDTETFTLNIFSGMNMTGAQLGTFTFGPQDNFSTKAGNALFVGALSNMSSTLIGSATLSSLSVAVGIAPNNGNNDFFFGPTQVQAAGPVPEASTVVGFGAGVLLFGGLILSARRRRSGGAPEAA